MTAEKLKNKWLLVAAGIIGLLLLIVPQFLTDSKKEDVTSFETEDIEYYSERIEKKLADLISQATGSENIGVIVTLDSSSEYLYAANTKTSDGSSAADYIVLNGGDKEGGLALGKIYPKVRGVAVVCSGGSTPAVKNEITQLVAAALGISTARIMVCGQE